jgi:hypothetical protein
MLRFLVTRGAMVETVCILALYRYFTSYNQHSRATHPRSRLFLIEAI